MVSTRRGPPVSGISSAIGDGCGIMLDLRRILSLRIGPTFDRLRIPLAEDAPRRGVDVGTRREGLSPCSPFLGICKMEASSSLTAEWFMLLSESGGTRLTGESFSSDSCRHPSDVAPCVLRNPGSRRLGLGRLQVLDRRFKDSLDEEGKVDDVALGTATKLRLRLSSVRSSSHSLSEPATEWLRPMLSALSLEIMEIIGGFSFCPASSRSPFPASSLHWTTFFSLSETRR